MPAESSSTGATGDTVPLSPTGFATAVAGKLAEQLQDVVGLEDASSFLAAVGAAIGEEISETIGNRDPGAPRRRPTPEEIGALFVDVKQRIGGRFRVIDVTDQSIELSNDICPFTDHAKGRPALCMMTSNVFGRIAAARTGYAHVSIREAIATGQDCCRVVVSLREGCDSDGQEYFA